MAKFNLLGWKEFLELLCDLGVEALGEVDGELDDELPLLEGVAVGRHALANNALEVAVLHDFACGKKKNGKLH